jgi:hypothetical protein
MSLGLVVKSVAFVVVVVVVVVVRRMRMLLGTTGDRCWLSVA